MLTTSKPIVSFHIFFVKILVNNTEGKRADHLGKEMKDTFTHMKIFIAITLLCFAVFSLYPMYAYVAEDRLVQLVRMEMPYLDQTNLKDYLIALVIMLGMAGLATIGVLAFDLMVLVLLLQYGSLVTQFILDLEEYNEIWTDKESYSQRYRDVFLRNMCLKYHDLDKLNVQKSVAFLFNSFSHNFTVTFVTSINCSLTLLVTPFAYCMLR